VLVCACDCRHVRFIVAAGGGSRCDVWSVMCDVFWTEKGYW
jgi:hypothetical protein